MNAPGKKEKRLILPEGVSGGYPKGEWKVSSTVQGKIKITLGMGIESRGVGWRSNNSRDALEIGAAFGQNAGLVEHAA